MLWHLRRYWSPALACPLPASGLLTTRKLDNPAGDCGLAAIYAATPSGFVLVERREMPVCHNLGIAHWIRTNHADTVEPSLK